ncbi:MAG: transcriptional repressor [Firmicutes bacterium]|nr:transcriptional repressor [Bacillota bacterium]
MKTNEEQVLIEYLRQKDLKYTEQRRIILESFLKTETHFTVDDLYAGVKEVNQSIGYTTIYRTLKLFVECGLASEMKFKDGITRYEHRFGHEHHDHLICVRCGQLIEVVEPEIEELQEKLARKHNFKIEHHRMELYGICKKCINEWD